MGFSSHLLHLSFLYHLVAWMCSRDEYALLKWRIHFIQVIHVIELLLHDAQVGMELYCMNLRLSLLPKLLEHLLIHTLCEELDLSCHFIGGVATSKLARCCLYLYEETMFPCFSSVFTSSQTPAHPKWLHRNIPKGKKRRSIETLCVCVCMCAHYLTSLAFPWYVCILSATRSVCSAAQDLTAQELENLRRHCNLGMNCFKSQTIISLFLCLRVCMHVF